MPIKDYLYEQSIQFFVILFFSIVYLITQLLLSHVTHSLTLQFDSYHMICKIIALTGRIITLKYSKRKTPIISSENGHTNLNTPAQTLTSNGTILNQHQNGNVTMMNGVNGKMNNSIEENKFINDSRIIPASRKQREDHESKLRNTFGWARINVLTMSIIFVVIASLAFSNIVEAVHHSAHMNHNHSIHHPLPLLVCGACGLLISGLCYFLVGGYTTHLINFCKFKNQSHNLYVCDDTKKSQYNGNIINSNLNVKSDNLNGQLKQDLKFNSDEDIFMMNNLQRPGLYEIITDISSSIFVMISGLLVHLVETNYKCIDGKYIDPILAIISSLFLLIMIYPYMREACMILLQTIPGAINIQIFHKNLLEKFQEISVHDLHIWSLTSKNYVSTVHIIFKDQSLYLNTINEIRKYFYEQGITNVSIQPEFLCAKTRSTMQNTTASISDNSTIQQQQTFSSSNSLESFQSSKYQHSNSNMSCCNDCLIPCLTEACAEKSCCNIFGNLKEIITDSSQTSPSTLKMNKCCQSDKTSKLINGNLAISSIPSSNSCIQQQQQEQNLETLNVKNLEQKLSTASSHTIKFNNNKNNRNFEELNGNYKILKPNNNIDDCTKESESNIETCKCQCNCSNVNDNSKIPVEEQNLNENLNITEKSLNDESNNIS